MPCRATACACAWTRATWSRSTTEPLRTAARSATMAGPEQTAFADVPHAVRVARQRRRRAPRPADVPARHGRDACVHAGRHLRLGQGHAARPGARSEEHTSELQSLMRISY